MSSLGSAIFSYQAFLGPLFGFALFYGFANMIKSDTPSLRTQGDCALFAIKGLGILFVLGAVLHFAG